MNKQAEMVKQMTDKQLLLNLYLSQGLFLLIAIILGFLYFNSWSEFFLLFSFDWTEIIILGGIAAIFVITIDLVLYKVLPKHMLDDGGINEKVFARRSLYHIFIIALVVAVCEEILFRGVLQSAVGYVVASLIFAVIHIRYLYKPILFIVVVGISFMLGWLFLKTNNLYVPMFAHFLIDFVLGSIIMIMYKKELKNTNDNNVDMILRGESDE